MPLQRSKSYLANSKFFASNAWSPYLPYAISLNFASVRWQALITSRQKMETVLDRRQLEVCVFHYLAQGRSVPGRVAAMVSLLWLIQTRMTNPS